MHSCRERTEKEDKSTPDPHGLAPLLQAPSRPYFPAGFKLFECQTAKPASVTGKGKGVHIIVTAK